MGMLCGFRIGLSATCIFPDGNILKYALQSQPVVVSNARIMVAKEAWIRVVDEGNLVLWRLTVFTDPVFIDSSCRVIDIVAPYCYVNMVV